jgi:AcrR family transcriptional regulator
MLDGEENIFLLQRERALSTLPCRGMIETRRQVTETGVSARDRILDASYELFSQRGIRAVGVNQVIERADVATATLYRHFPSKDELVLAFLQLREQRWTKDFVEAGAISRSSDPEQQLLAIFDVFDEWFHRNDFEACSFINVLLEMGPEHPAGGASVWHLEQIRSIVRRLAEEAGLRDTESLARSFHILMKGSIVAASEGDTQAAQRSKSMASLLIEQHR